MLLSCVSRGWILCRCALDTLSVVYYAHSSYVGIPSGIVRVYHMSVDSLQAQGAPQIIWYVVRTVLSMILEVLFCRLCIVQSLDMRNVRSVQLQQISRVVSKKVKHPHNVMGILEVKQLIIPSY